MRVGARNARRLEDSDQRRMRRRQVRRAFCGRRHQGVKALHRDKGERDRLHRRHRSGRGQDPRLFDRGDGDSFGAGVGNPDIPAQMESDGRNDLYYYRIFRHGILSSGNHDFSGEATELRRYLPARRGLNGGSGGDEQAQWLDMRCFRSQYGPQFRAALQLAAALKHNSVTYVDLACSGATVLQGLLGSKPLDLGFRPGLPPVPAQLEDAARIVCDHRAPPWTVTVKLQTKFNSSACGGDSLCEFKNDKTLDLGALQSATGLTLNQSPAPHQIQLSGCGDDGYRRPIDYILLSIGGNDIGFASLVAQDALLANTLDFDVLRHFLQYALGAIEDPEGRRRQSQLSRPDLYAAQRGFPDADADARA